MSICLVTLQNTVCLQLCLKSRSHFFHLEAVPSDSIAVGFLMGPAWLCCPWSSSGSVNCGSAAEAILTTATCGCPPTPAVPSCSCNNLWQRTKERNFYTYPVFQRWLESMQRGGITPNPFFPGLSFPFISEHRNPPLRVSDTYLGSWKSQLFSMSWALFSGHLTGIDSRREEWNQSFISIYIAFIIPGLLWVRASLRD